MEKRGRKKQRFLWLVLASGALVCLGFFLATLSRGAEWTTSSREALEEFDAAMLADMKLYNEEAQWHLERALELDSEFVIAKVYLANFIMASAKSEGIDLMQQAVSCDAELLTPREQFLLKHAHALLIGKTEDASTALDNYLLDFKDDPYALRIKAEDTWADGSLEESEKHYLHLLEVSPNWVVAYNNLGYLAMSQGHFIDAEKYFTSYRFIAPDQANPHDSLGELYIVVGRLDDAIKSFEAAITIKPDFWDSYVHMVTALSLQGAFSEASAVIERAVDVGGCSSEDLSSMKCTVEYFEPLFDNNWDQILKKPALECLQKSGSAALFATLIHRAACEGGEWKRAASLETALIRAAKRQKSDDLVPYVWHMEAVHMALKGNLSKASARFRQTDESFTYGSSELGLLKLLNRLMEVDVLHAQGHEKEAHRKLSEVIRINHPLVITYRECSLGLKDSE